MALIVIDPGLSTTVQDAGRPGYREWGVPLGGAFDRGSAELAGALVGNPSRCAVLELTLLGGTYQAESRLALAPAPAPFAATGLRPASPAPPPRPPVGRGGWAGPGGAPLPVSAALARARHGRQPGGGWSADRRGRRLRDEGGVSARRPRDLRRSGPAGTAEAGGCERVSPRDIG